MNIEQIRAYCLSKNGVTEAFPFDADTLVFKVLGKMFVLIPLEQREKGAATINLKASPEYAEELRLDYQGIKPGFHMNKKHWNTIHLYKGEFNVQFILELVDHSYLMVVKGMPKKQQELLRDEK